MEGTITDCLNDSRNDNFAQRHFTLILLWLVCICDMDDNNIHFITFSRIEKVIPSCSAKWVSSLITEMLCLFNSQIPSSSSIEEPNLKFVEVHHEFRRHSWPHDNKLGESNLLTTYPKSCLFPCVSKYDEWEADLDFSSVEKAVILWKTKSNRTFLHSIRNRLNKRTPARRYSNVITCCLVASRSCDNKVFRRCDQLPRN